MHMSAGSKIGVTLVLMLFLGGLAAADTLSTEGSSLKALLPTFSASSSEPMPAIVVSETSEGSAQSQGNVVTKNSGPILADAAGQLGMSLQESTAASILAGIANDKTRVYSQVILKDGDRIGTVTWMESPQVKVMFAGLKEALISEFSDKLTGLRDETIQEEGKPVRNVLSFTDPAIADEPVAIARVRERLYEFRTAPGKEADMAALQAGLTER